MNNPYDAMLAGADQGNQPDAGAPSPSIAAQQPPNPYAQALASADPVPAANSNLLGAVGTKNPDSTAQAVKEAVIGGAHK